jgi:hypothetical protein
MVTGEVYATFRSVVPATGLPPSVDVGFLPPEDGTGRGQGHIGYTIRPKSDLVTGAALRNVALIVFDQNAAIATNQRDPHDPRKGTDPRLEALVTLDGGPPSSAVLPLPRETVGSVFPVEWSGQDDPGGVGVAAYDVYVSEDSGPWGLWQHDRTETSATFHGQLGSTYAFFSVARDYLGHEEAFPVEADTVTTLVVNSSPELGIRLVDGLAVVSWSLAAEGFELETTTDLVDPLSWQPEAAAPQISGDHYVLGVEPGDQPRYYRLAKPD